MSVDAMTTEAAGERRLLDSEEFRDVMGRFASGVTVITADHEGRRYGTTASAVSSLSLEPAMLLLMGLVTGFIVIAMLSAVFSVNQMQF